MIAEDRRKKILLLIKKEKTVSVSKLASILHVTTSVLYKDLDLLEKQKYIKKFYGGVKILDEEKTEHAFYRRLKQNINAKKNIANQALKMIAEGDILFIDSSTTCFYLCEEIKKAHFSKLTIITNSLFIPLEFILNDKIKIISLGGILNTEIGSFSGIIANNFNNNMHADKFFMSPFALSVDIGVMDPYIPDDVKIKELFLNNSGSTICLADSTKFNKRGEINWAALDKMNIIITDSMVDQKIVDVLRNKKIKTMIAELK
jgi:DeoR/GlpR family transcriptional regulator of sugar metabolism